MNGCSDIAILTQSVSACTGLAIQSALNNEIKVYPNPFYSKFTIVTSEHEQAIKIYNAIGSVIYVTAIDKESLEVDLSNYPNGIYFIRIGSITKKIIKQ